MKTYNSDQWHAWMTAALDGDQKAYKALLSNVQSWLGAFFSSRVEDRAVDDLVQDTLLTIHNKRHTFDPNQAFGPWLTAIAKHRAIDHFRKVQRQQETDLDEAFIEPLDFVDGASARDVEYLLSTLPDAQAQAIKLLKLQQLSLQEASEQTGHSVSALKVMVHRGIKKLQKTYEKTRQP